MIKKIKLLVFANLIIAMSCFAQLDVKINPISPFNGNINGSVEVGLANAFSINTKINKTLTHAQLFGKDCYDNAMLVNIMPRLYFNKTKNLKGLYGNLMLEYGEYDNTYQQYDESLSTVKNSALENTSIVSSQPTGVVQYQLKRGNVGLALGYKFLIKSKIVIDGHFGYLRNVHYKRISDNTQAELDNYIYENPNELSANITIGYRFMH